MITIDYLSLAIGAGIMLVLSIITWKIVYRRRMKNVIKCKNLIEECHSHLGKAAENLNQLYTFFIEVERMNM